MRIGAWFAEAEALEFIYSDILMDMKGFNEGEYKPCHGVIVCIILNIFPSSGEKFNFFYAIIDRLRNLTAT